jgi:DnaJ family protein B protein 4
MTLWHIVEYAEDMFARCCRASSKKRQRHECYPRSRAMKHTVLSILLLLFLTTTNCVVASSSKSFYSTLGVPKHSSADDIKKAYRKLALKHHPDKGGKEEDFKEISKAYDTLSDPEKRQLYDNYGEAGLGAGDMGSNPFAGGGQSFNFGGNGGPGDNMFSSYFPSEGRQQQQGGQHFQGSSFGGPGGGATNIDLSDFLKQFMGGRAGGGGGGQPGASSTSRPSYTSTPPKTFTRTVKCTLEELATGATKKLKVSYKGEDKVYTIHLKPGWKDGTKVKFNNQKQGRPNMVFVVQQVPHKNLRRIDDDLFFTCWISPEQKAGGINVKVQLPTGEVCSQVIPKSSDDSPAITSGKKLVVSGKGMPIKGGPECGDLIVEFRVRQTRS